MTNAIPGQQAASFCHPREFLAIGVVSVIFIAKKRSLEILVELNLQYSPKVLGHFANF